MKRVSMKCAERHYEKSLCDTLTSRCVEASRRNAHQSGRISSTIRVAVRCYHYEAITAKELKEIKTLSTARLWRDFRHRRNHESEESQDAGAIGLFEDKYRDVVRVVSWEIFRRALRRNTCFKYERNFNVQDSK